MLKKSTETARFRQRSSRAAAILFADNRPRSIYQYSNMAPRLLGQNSIFGVVFFVSKSLLRIERQKKLEKFAILTRKPRSHARILIYQTWPIDQSEVKDFLIIRNPQHGTLLCDKLLAGVVVRATKLCNLQSNKVARQVARKCCPYYLGFKLPKIFTTSVRATPSY